jgi:hypothetical protein
MNALHAFVAEGDLKVEPEPFLMAGRKSIPVITKTKKDDWMEKDEVLLDTLRESRGLVCHL